MAQKNGKEMMSPSITALEALNEHWAVAAIGVDELKRAEIAVHQRLVRQTAGKQISIALAEEDTSLERIALAYELAAIEGLDELRRPTGENCHLRDQAVAASFRAFDIRRLLPIPKETHDRLFFVLQLSAIAYCGDRWSDLRRWYREREEALRAPSVVGTSWDHRLLYRLFDCWILLFRKQGQDDLNRIREIVAGLRNDQKNNEARCLQNGSEAMDRMIALRLAALYNWAKGTETLATYMLQMEQDDPFGTLHKHFEAGINAATASGDARFELTLRWLHATTHIMVKNSLGPKAWAVNSHTAIA